MPNTLITPAWIVEDLMRTNTLRMNSLTPKWERAVQCIINEHRQSQSVDLRVVVALGAAAIVANPQPISRRALFGLAWKVSK